jgi:hypothetical protein
LAKSEIALLTVSVFGTLTAWLAGPHPSLVTPIYDEPSIARSAPATAFRGIRPSFGEGNASFAQVSPMFHVFPYLSRTELHQATVWPCREGGKLSQETTPNSESLLWQKCSTL